MVEFKFVIADPKAGKCYQKEIKDDEARSMLGLKIRDKVKGEKMGLKGYEFEITGGSGKSGFPMRKDVEGTARKKVLLTGGKGTKRKGQKQRKSVRGNTIGLKTSQINVKILKYGKEKLGEPEKEEPEEGASENAEKKEEKPKEEKKDKEKEKEDKPAEEEASKE